MWCFAARPDLFPYFRPVADVAGEAGVANVVLDLVDAADLVDVVLEKNLDKVACGRMSD